MQLQRSQLGTDAHNQTCYHRQIHGLKRCKPVRQVSAQASPEYQALTGIKVVSAADGQDRELLSLWQSNSASKVLVPFLTHFADLSSWELVQKLKQIVLPRSQQLGVQVITVGLGSVENARIFAAALDYPTAGLYADPTGACYKALGFSPGFAADAQLNPYFKLLPMLAGIESPGTLQEVIRGYIGDQSARQVFQESSPFDILGKGYQRPFELATLRLLNMVGILPKWSQLSPPDANLLTQQGGALVFEGQQVLFKHMDSGILKHTDVDALVAALEARDAAGSIAGQQQ